MCNDCVEHLIFEAHLSTSAGSHLNATCKDHVTHMRSFVTKELFNHGTTKMKGELADMLLIPFFFLFSFFFSSCF
jgi:hypothetical protein